MASARGFDAACSAKDRRCTKYSGHSKHAVTLWSRLVLLSESLHPTAGITATMMDTVIPTHAWFSLLPYSAVIPNYFVDHLKELGLDGRIILKSILNKSFGRA